MKNFKTFNIGFKNNNIGENVTLSTSSNIYGATIGNDVFIGPFVEVQKDVTIGSRTRIQSHSFICEMTTIGEDCFVSHGVMFVNDTFSTGGPAKGNKNLWKKTTIGNKVFIGTNATLLPVNICNNVVIGAGSVVTKNIVVPGIYYGNPAKKSDAKY